jgi:hypothetical protein
MIDFSGSPCTLARAHLPGSSDRSALLFQIDHQLELRRLLNGQVSGASFRVFGSFEITRASGEFTKQSINSVYVATKLLYLPKNLSRKRRTAWLAQASLVTMRDIDRTRARDQFHRS